MEAPGGESNGLRHQKRHQLVANEEALTCSPLFAGGVAGSEEEDAAWSTASFFLAGHSAAYDSHTRSLFLFGGYDGRYPLLFLSTFPSLLERSPGMLT